MFGCVESWCISLLQVGYRVPARLQKLSPQSNSLDMFLELDDFSNAPCCRRVIQLSTRYADNPQNLDAKQSQPNQRTNSRQEPNHTTNPFNPPNPPNQPNHQPTWTFIPYAWLYLVYWFPRYVGKPGGGGGEWFIRHGCETAFWFPRKFPAKVPELYNCW